MYKSAVGDHTTATRYTGVFNQPLVLGLASWGLAGQCEQGVI